MNSHAILVQTVLLLVALPFNGLAKNEQALQPDTTKKCTICHYEWIPAFFLEHRKTPIAEFKASDQDLFDLKLCISCHDGSVRDSRREICNDYGHRSGRVPSKRITIPETFPLDNKGALKCTTCHTPHTVTKPNKAMVQFFLRAPNNNSSFCKQCHKKNTGGKLKGNHPVDVPVKSAIQPLIQAGGKFGSQGGNEIICESCHNAHGVAGSKFLLLPDSKTKTLSFLCELCHTRKAYKPGEAEGYRVSHPVDIKPKHTFDIPSSWDNGNRIVLEANGKISCRTCHRAHYAIDGKFILAANNSNDALCITCHISQVSIIGTSHDLQVSAPYEKNSIGNQAAKSGPCSPCHIVHRGTAQYLWGRERSNTQQHLEEFCTTCHASGQCAEKKLPGDYSHPLNVKYTGEHESLPLFTNNANKVSSGFITCMTCHDVHNPAPAAQSNGEKMIRGKFLRLANQGVSTHCLRCHITQASVADTPHDIRKIGNSNVKNLLGQSSQQSGLCGSCHAAHNAPQKLNLWAAPIGKKTLYDLPDIWENKGTKSIGFCTGCHAEGGIAKNRIPQFELHPQAYYGGPVITYAKNTDNIEKSFLNTNSKISFDNGTIVCETCHNVHNWGSRTGGQSITLSQSTITEKFLRPNIPKNLCKVCHGGEALFRFLYFHKKQGR